MNYLHFDETIINDFSDNNISEMYEKGYVFTRIGRGVMQQTRSIRINLTKFELNSENRRILRKTSDINISIHSLPLTDYNYSLGKLAKDFYETKFGPGIMSAQKIKEMLSDKEKSNFNSLIKYSAKDDATKSIGYAICYYNPELLHYSYPFYDLKNTSKDMGLGMMVKAIEYAKNAKMKYIYLGSLQRPTDIYKLQFNNLEWFDGKKWSSDIDAVKILLTEK